MIARVAIVALPLLVAVVLHEVAHGVVAYRVRRSDGCPGRAAHVEPVAARRSGRHVARSGPLAGHLARVRQPSDVLRLGEAGARSIRAGSGGRGSTGCWSRWRVPARTSSWLPRARWSLGWLAGRAGPGAGAHRFLSALVAPVGGDQLRAGRLQSASRCRRSTAGACSPAILPVAAAARLRRIEGVGFVVVLLVVFNTGILSTLVRPVLSPAGPASSRGGPGRIGRSGGPAGDRQRRRGRRVACTSATARRAQELGAAPARAPSASSSSPTGTRSPPTGRTRAASSENDRRDGARLARGRARPGALHDLPAVGREGARRALPAPRHDDARPVARAQSDLQGAARAAASTRDLSTLRLSRLPGAAGGRRPHLQGDGRAGRASTRRRTSSWRARSRGASTRPTARSFPSRETLLTETPKILGTDGRKMSKSYDNAVYLTEPPDGRRPQALAHGDRSAARAAHRPRRARPTARRTCRSTASTARPRSCAWQEEGCRTRRHRLPRVQEGDDQARAGGAGADPRAPAPD